MQKLCSHCQSTFVPAYVFQLATSKNRERQYFCTIECRRAVLGEGGFRSTHRARRIAVLNHKGGTGKTTTSISLAAGLAERGQRVLLVDTDAQGNVGLSLGLTGEHNLYHVIAENLDPDDAIVPVRKNFDIITSSQLLAAAEVWLARQDAELRSGVLAQRLQTPDISKAYDYILLDCGPSLNLLNQNALNYADEVIIPVNCDYLSLVGVKQVLGTIREVEKHLRHTVRVSGVLPTFFDSRTKLACEVLETLRGHFKTRCLPPIRSNTKLAEAPSRRKTIFEHAPDSNGAEDYLRIVDWLVLENQRKPSANAAA
jgi:chromosome partitioning protein